MGQELAGSEVSRTEADAASEADPPTEEYAAGPLDEASFGARMLEWPVLRRCRWALWLNMLVPGAGLIGLQRQRAGLAVAILFGLTGQVAAVGLLIAPQSIGQVVTAGATVGAGLAWLVGQILLLKRLNELQDPARRLAAARWIEQAREAVLTAGWAEASRALREASRYDDEQPDLNWLLAKVMTATSRSDLAAKQWRRLRQVDKAGRYAKEVERYLQDRGQELGVGGLP